MESTSDKPLVLVTGISGYLGSWCAKKAIDSGKYRVRGSVRNKDNKEQMEILQEGFGEDFKDIEIVSADLSDEESMTNAVHGCDYVIHVASPLPLTTPKNFEKEVIEPAVNGVKYVLQASVHSTVKKVIITSSANTVQDQLKGDGTYGKDSFIKEHKGMNGYYRSKNRSEKFAFDFMRSLSKEDRTFEMCVINPGIIVGTTFLRSAKGAVLGLFTDALNGKKISLPQTYYPHSDVQDCGDAHVNAIELGEDLCRYPLASGNMKFRAYFDYIKEEFEPKGYKIRHSELSKCTIWIGSWFNKDAKNFLWQWNVKAFMDGEYAAKKLNLTYKDARESSIDLANSLINLGLVNPPKKK